MWYASLPVLCCATLQCSSYTCGAGFTADTFMQSTVCPSGTCTDNFCCVPGVRDHLPAAVLMHQPAAAHNEWQDAFSCSCCHTSHQIDVMPLLSLNCSALGTPVALAIQPTPASSPQPAPPARAQTASAARHRCAGILRQALACDGNLKVAAPSACCLSCIDGETSCNTASL